MPTAEKDGFVRIVARRSGKLRDFLCEKQPGKADRSRAISKQPSIRKYFPLTRTMSIRHAPGKATKVTDLSVDLLQRLPSNVTVDERHGSDCVHCA